MSDWSQGKYGSEAYLQSLSHSSRDLQGQIGSALSEIGKQRGLFQEKAAMLPGAAAQANDAGSAQLNQGLQQLGLGPATGAVAGSFQGSKDSYARAALLAHTGFNEQAVQRTTQAQDIGQQIQAGYTADANRYISGRDAEEQARQFAAQEAERQRLLQVDINDQRQKQEDIARWHAAEEANRQREFQSQQGGLDRQAQQGMAAMLLAPTQSPQPAGYLPPKAAPKPAPKPKMNRRVT